ASSGPGYTIYTDDFTDTDDTLLTSRLAPTTGNWLSVGGIASAKILNNSLAPASPFSGSQGGFSAIGAGKTNYRISALMTIGSSGYAGFLFRAKNAADELFYVYLNRSSNELVAAYRNPSNSDSIITTVSYTYAAPITMEVRNFINYFDVRINNEPLIVVTDARAFKGNLAGPFLNAASSDTRIDNFSLLVFD
ncbi:MAG: hypothetical protein WCD18_18395, partial [Thermosynechococcaceae cyanobacterium]